MQKRASRGNMWLVYGHRVMVFKCASPLGLRTCAIKLTKVADRNHNGVKPLLICCHKVFLVFLLQGLDLHWFGINVVCEMWNLSITYVPSTYVSDKRNNLLATYHFNLTNMFTWFGWCTQKAARPTGVRYLCVFLYPDYDMVQYIWVFWKTTNNK